MSRLIVKGLPSRYDDKQLRELFSFAGEITDARVIKTRDGRSRQFGFVGFRTSQEAKSARHRLNKSYVDTARVSVDFAHAVGADAIPRPWSKYSKGSSLHEKRTRSEDESARKEFLRKEAERNKRLRDKKLAEEKKAAEEKHDPLLEDFRDTASKRASKPIWADERLRSATKSTLVPSRKKGGEGKMLERKHVTFDSDDSEEEGDDLYEDIAKKFSGQEEKDSPDEVGDSVALDEAVSDMDYFKSKVISDGDCEEGKPEERRPKEGRHEEGKPEEGRQEISSREDGDDLGEDLRKMKSSKPRLRGKDKAKNEEPNETPATATDEEESNEDTERAMNVAKPSSTRNNGEALSKNQDPPSVDASETGRLMVRNLAFALSEEELEAAFEDFGMLSDVHIVRDGKTGKSRGMAFIQYVVPENAPKALLALDGTFLSGRIIHVLPARSRLAQNTRTPLGRKQGSTPGSSSFKAEKDEMQKDAARRGLDKNAQHALHLSSDAVAAIVSERHGVSKSELYGTTRGESGIAAVRLAMAEANIQGEIRDYFLDNGIDLNAAEKANVELNATTAAARRKRESRTAFLVKNLPARTSERDLRDKFVPFGTLNRMIVAPSGLLAVVQYASASDAKRAHNGLAYTKFRDTPLYLEWLPTDAFKDASKNSLQSTTEATVNSAPPSASPLLQSGDNEEPSGRQSSNSGSVYVKNLNFDTRDAGLKSHFAKALRRRPELVHSLRSAKVAMKRGREGKESEMLSMGFGFLEFSSKEHAMEAMKLAQNSVLDGHTLQLRLSTGRDENHMSIRGKKRARGKNQKPGPKLIVRNVAFEATRRDINQLFSAFGELKTVRIPRRPDGSHRGFAFVEFISKGEAKAALDSLTSAHLYGRHLVIEYANEEADALTSLEALQERAAVQVAKKRIRANDGRAVEPSDAATLDENNDEQARLQDELYG